MVYVNCSERYGEIVEVCIDDYRKLNPDGLFRQYDDGIYEYSRDNETLVEIVAVPAK
jgi:hypothetical protein